MASRAPVITPTSIEDPLAHLSRTDITYYRKGQAIYHQGDPFPSSLYLVIEGKVKSFRLTDEGQSVVLEIYQADDLFGESAFLHLPKASEEAVAMENTKLMSWTVDDIKSLIMAHPELGIALVQMLARRTLDLAERVEKYSNKISGRVAHALIRFLERMGTREPDGSVSMRPLTHQLLSQYVGTSREIITYNLNLFRHEGFLSYSRSHLSLQPDACKEWLRKNGRHRRNARAEELPGRVTAA